MDEVAYPRAEVLRVLRDINMLVVSIDRIGSYTHDMSVSDSALVLHDFFDAWDVGRRLARVRRLLSVPFSTELGADNMDHLERELQGTPHWSATHRHPPVDEMLASALPEDE